MGKALDLAHAQLIGYVAGRYDSLDSLITAMGLTYTEWNKIKKEYSLGFLSEEDIAEIDEIIGIPVAPKPSKLEKS